MKSVKVIFRNSEYNYSTHVNINSSDEELREYFVGALFNVGVYPVEKMRECIDIEISK